MRQKLLITTAIAGLLAGTIMATAQVTPRQDGNREAPAQSQRAPQAEQRGPAAEQRAPEANQQQQGPKRERSQTQREPNKQDRTTGQGGREPEQRTQEQRREPNAQRRQDEPKSQAQQPSNRDQKNAQQPSNRNQATQGKGNFTPEQRTHIRSTVIARGPHPRNINVSVRVGVVIPATVEVVAVPEEIIEVYPNYRGLLYFVYNDEIIIVDRSHKIVAVIVV